MSPWALIGLADSEIMPALDGSAESSSDMFNPSPVFAVESRRSRLIMVYGDTI